MVGTRSRAIRGETSEGQHPVQRLDFVKNFTNQLACRNMRCFYKGFTL